MRLIMLGTGPFAVPTLKALAASRHELALVITRPPTGRNTAASPIQLAAETLGLSVWSPDTVNSRESQSRVSSLGADLFVVCDYGEILRSETLFAARLGGINLHGSLLPKYRGAAPVQWAVLKGETETGNSIIQMTPGLDAGPLLAHQRTPIDPDEDAEQLESRLAAMGAGLVLGVIDQLESETSTPIAQDSTEASKAPRLKKEQGAIDWSQSALEIKNQVRALRAWPRTHTFWQREDGTTIRVNIDRVSISAGTPGGVSPTGQSDATAAPGSILEAGKCLAIATGGGSVLEVLEIQPAGKRSMSAAEFLRGYRPTTRDRFASA